MNHKMTSYEKLSSVWFEIDSQEFQTC